MKLEENKKYYFLSDKIYKEVLYDIKKSNKEYDIKVIDKNEFYSMFSFSYSDRVISYLLKKEKYDYSKIKKLLRILKIGNYSKHTEFKELNELFNELKNNNLLQFDTFADLNKKEREILLFECDDDFELISFLNRNNFTFKTITFETLDIKPQFRDNFNPTIYNFDSKFLQYNYLFSDIRNKIINNIENKYNIFILIEDANDIFYINYLSKIYKIDSNISIKIPLISNQSVSTLIDKIYKSKNFNILDELKVKNEYIERFDFLINKYEINKLKNFDFAYSCLIEILSNEQYIYNYSNKGLSFTSDIFFSTSYFKPLVYLLNYQYDTFYHEFDDNDFYPDSILEKLKVNPSYIKTKIDRKNKLNFILYNKIEFLSRVLIHLDDKIYDSQFNNELNWKIIKPEKHNLDGIYTQDAYELLNSYYKDIYHCPKDNKYKNYDQSYLKIKDNFKKDTFNITEFESYFNCPYAYYLNNVLNINDFDSKKNIPALRGNLIHKIFEDIYTHNYENDFDGEYDKVFNHAKDEYIKQAAEYYSVEQEVYLSFIHKWLKDIIKAILRQKANNNSNIISETHEESINFKYKNYIIKGRIDKIVYTKDSNNRIYYTLIDYKSGSSGNFVLNHVFLGGSLQLPLYEFGIENIMNCHLNNENSYIFGGFGIQHLYFNSGIPITKSDKKYTFDSIHLKTIISGISKDDISYIQSFDKSLIKETKNGLKLLKQGDFLLRNNPFDNNRDFLSNDYSYLSYLEDLKSALENSINNITNGNFNIKPTKDGNKSKELCQFCPHIDICYRRKKDIYDISKDIHNHFNELNDNLVDDEMDDSEEEDE